MTPLIWLSGGYTDITTGPQESWVNDNDAAATSLSSLYRQEHQFDILSAKKTTKTPIF